MTAENSRPYPLTTPTGVLSPATMDRSRRLAWQDVQRTDITRKTGPSTDPTHSEWINKFNLSQQFRLLFGKIVDSIAYVNAYKVQPEAGLTAIWCTALTHTALQPIGSRQLGQIPVGANVIFALHPTDSSGVIIGVIPDAQTNSQSGIIDFISQAGRSGLLVDSVHYNTLTHENSSLITDWSAGRPFDATTHGEAGHITETGLLQFLDSFMSASRVDEECGVWHFYTDGITRIAGHNLQVWTTGSEREELDDDGEFNVVHGYTPYFWEALGSFDPEKEVSKEFGAQCWQKDQDLQGYAAREPCDDQQTAFYRLREFYGYLGQANKRLLTLLPQGCQDAPLETFGEGPQYEGAQCEIPTCDDTDLNLLPDETIMPGVFEETLSLTGRWAVRSAHEVIISKHILIPAPKQTTLPQDPIGDNNANYLSAGLLGTGDDHAVVGEIAVTGGENPTQIRALGFLDTHAFAFNWIGDHPFHYHENDWYIPNEADLSYLTESCTSPTFAPPFYAELACYHFINAPEAIPLYVDHRYENVNYYPNHSYFALLADGGVVIGDGFGAELKMANGHIWLTAPGDANIHVGRNIVNLAGHDYIARAKNSWDISATTKDGRLKAKNNLWLLSSGDAGGILLQCNALSPGTNEDEGEEAVMSGISIKAENSLIGLCAADLSIKLSEVDEEEHVIALDTGWNGRLKFRSKYFERFIADDGAALDFWCSDDTTVVGGNEWWSEGALIGSPLVVNNKLLVSDCGIFQDNIISVEGHIITRDAVDTVGKVGVLGDNELDAQFDYFADRQAELPAIGATELENLVEYQTDFTFCDVDFSFRTVDNYRTADFVIFESRWQQIARVGGASVNTWTEEEVNDTYPYPGKEILEGTTLRTLNPLLYDINSGTAEDRGAIYESPAFAIPGEVTLNGNYTVII